MILRPCDWYGLPFGRLLATPPDGKAVTKFADLHDAFYEVTKAIRVAAEELGSHGDTATEMSAENQTSVTGATRSSERQDIRSGNLRVKKQFSDHEKDQFLDDAFEYIANYFENSLNELEDRNPEVDSRFKRIDSNQFSVTVYTNGVRKSGCRIWIGGRYFNGTIGFSFNESRDDGSYNEMIRVEDDGYSLFLKAMGIQLQHRAGNAPLTNEGGAEYLWRMFIEPLQR